MDIKVCDQTVTCHCSLNVTVRAMEGDVENDLFFCGAGVKQVTEITTVAQTLKEYRLVLA